jgi:phosphoglycerate dehydrogenase-like enzyme
MAMHDRVRVLIGNPEPELLEQVRAISEHLELVTPDDLSARPELLGELEVAFGGLSRKQLPKAKRLRWLQTGGAGVNGLLTPELRDSDLILTNASGIHAEPITEHMFGMLLMVTRRLGEARDQQQCRQWKGYDFAGNVSLLSGKTLGILGVGAIGSHSARVGQGFGMRVIGLRRTEQPHPHVDRMYGEAERLDFFREADVIMNSLPLTEKTRHAMSWDELAVMKPGAIVINTGRGATINTEALMAALRERRLGAALLDVTDPEPLPEDHPLWTMENVYITPHYSGSHPGYQERAGRIFLENLCRYLTGKPMLNVVDKQEGY